MELVITDTCIDNICKKLKCFRKDIKSIKVGGALFIIEFHTGAITTLDYTITDEDYDT